MAALFILAGTLLVGALGVTALNWIWVRRKLQRYHADWQEEVGVLKAEVNRIAEEWHERDKAPATATALPNGFNMNRRPEAVRRLHAGVAIDRVSIGTGWSIAEIALLQKVEQLSTAARN